MEWMNLLRVSKINDNKVDEFEGIKKYVATGGIDYNKIVEFEEVTYESKPSRANRRAEMGDILVAKMKDTVKVFKITEENCDEYIFSTGFCTLKANQDVLDTDYFYYVLISEDFQEQKNKYSKGATQKAINNTGLKKIKIPVPPIEIQKQIVEVLDEAQKLIDNRKKQIKLLDDLIESIFYDMFGDPVKNNKGWEVKKFDDFSNVRSSKRVYISECVDKGIPFYRGTEIVKLSLGEEVFPELFITEDHYKALKKETGIPKIGDLLLPSICAKGEVWRVDTNNPFYFKDGRVLWVELESDFIDSKYLQYCLSQVLIKNFEGIASGSTFPEMKIFILKNLEIPIPPLPLQNQFAEKVQAIEKQKELLQESIKLMEDNYNSLMQRAFKGELF